jgi:hypothetical protein
MNKKEWYHQLECEQCPRLYKGQRFQNNTQKKNTQDIKENNGQFKCAKHRLYQTHNILSKQQREVPGSYPGTETGYPD